MSTHANALALVAWVRERPGATVSEIVASGLMNRNKASHAAQYALRCGALERVIRSGVRANERVHYRATGVDLPVLDTQDGEPSFDGLLQAWGIVRNPPPLQVVDSRRHQIQDDKQESARG